MKIDRSYIYCIAILLLIPATPVGAQFGTVIVFENDDAEREHRLGTSARACAVGTVTGGVAVTRPDGTTFTAQLDSENCFTLFWDQTGVWEITIPQVGGDTVHVNVWSDAKWTPLEGHLAGNGYPVGETRQFCSARPLVITDTYQVTDVSERSGAFYGDLGANSWDLEVQGWQETVLDVPGTDTSETVRFKGGFGWGWGHQSDFTKIAADIGQVEPDAFNSTSSGALAAIWEQDDTDGAELWALRFGTRPDEIVAGVDSGNVAIGGHGIALAYNPNTGRLNLQEYTQGGLQNWVNLRSDIRAELGSGPVYGPLGVALEWGPVVNASADARLRNANVTIYTESGNVQRAEGLELALPNELDGSAGLRPYEVAFMPKGDGGSRFAGTYDFRLWYDGAPSRATLERYANPAEADLRHTAEGTERVWYPFATIHSETYDVAAETDYQRITVTAPGGQSFEYPAGEPCINLAFGEAGNYRLAWTAAANGATQYQVTLPAYVDTVRADQEQLLEDAIFWLPVLIFMAALIWSLWNGYRLPAVAATIGFALPVLDAASIGRLGIIYLFMLMLWLTWYTRHKQGLTEE